MDIEEIFKICTNANLVNLDKVLSTINNNKQKGQVTHMFNVHMNKIAQYCYENFEVNNISEKFIKGLHKIHYPEGYTESQKTIKGDATIITMIPGNYKTLNNYNWVEPRYVKNEIKLVFENYNSKINSLPNKKDIIIEFLINFLKIHPFGNGNARVISIIIDLMLINNNYKPIYFNKIQNMDKNLFEKEIINSIKNNTINNFSELIKNT